SVLCSERRFVEYDLVALNTRDRVPTGRRRLAAQSVCDLLTVAQSLLAFPEGERQPSTAISGREAENTLPALHLAHRREDLLLDVAHPLLELLRRASFKPADAYPHRALLS